MNALFKGADSENEKAQQLYEKAEKRTRTAEEAQNKAEAAVSQLQDELAQHKRQLGEAETSIEEKTKKNVALRNDIDALEVKRDELLKAEVQAKTEIDQLNSQLKGSKTKNAELKQSLKDLTESQHESKLQHEKVPFL